MAHHLYVSFGMPTNGVEKWFFLC